MQEFRFQLAGCYLPPLGLFLVLFISCCEVIYVFDAVTFAVFSLKRALLGGAVLLVERVGAGAPFCTVTTLPG